MKSRVFTNSHSMPKAKLQSVTVGDHADEIEAQFYDALRSGNIDQLMRCWADEDEISCVHPGGSRLVGTGAIRSAFEAMFANGTIRATPLRVRKIEALSSSVHSVIEKIEVMTPEGPREAYVIATNVYHKTAQGWRMVAHHASPGTVVELQEISDTPMTLH
jgi:ketosteroid isomerase-like protein